MDPVVVFERAATNAASMIEHVGPEQRDAPTPCSEWNVDALVSHMTDGPRYLLTALGLDRDADGATEGGHRAAVARCVEALRAPGALDRRCMSPAGFEWSTPRRPRERRWTS
jgi:hypothetical protein